jgi:hypothetical protein
MRIDFTLIMIFILAHTQAQTNKNNSDSSCKKIEFKNQGGQEDYWTRNIFAENYTKKTFRKYSGKIVVSGDTIKYLDKYFLTWVPSKFKNIFSSGIFYPTVITGQSKSSYRLKISNFEELDFLSKTPTQKKFRFWLQGIGLVNPTVCFIELTNQDATDNTDIETFINGASLTFYKEGWIVI